ncbi:MAG: sugar phosphate isomerase/epimerase [Bacteroidota bacterium]
MKRRTAIKNSLLGTGALLAASPFEKVLGQSPAEFESKINIGVQLFTIPKMAEADLKGTLQTLSELGYTEIEFFGPYGFSSEKAIADWENIKPMLGLEKNAFYGYSVKETVALLKTFKLSTPSLHTDLDTLRNNLDKMLDAVAPLEAKYLVLPAIQEQRNSLEDYKKYAEEFNAIGEKMSKYGMKFVYHNHGYEHKAFDGEIPMDFLLQNTNEAYVQFELDVFWMQAAGANPIDYLKAYPDRFKLLHLKDAKEPFRFAGDGTTPEEWVQGFPFMSDPGDGVYDIKGIVEQGIKSGVEHFFLERDLTPEPEKTLKNSYEYLAGL